MLKNQVREYSFRNLMIAIRLWVRFKKERLARKVWNGNVYAVVDRDIGISRLGGKDESLHVSR